MKTFKKNQQDFFKKCGQKGGQKRAQHMTPTQRSAIASKAAKARWNKSVEPMASIRLNHADMVNPVYLEELLAEGSLTDWANIYREISEFPFGKTAEALAKVLASTHIYGVTPLWREILRVEQNN